MHCMSHTCTYIRSYPDPLPLERISSRLLRTSCNVSPSFGNEGSYMGLLNCLWQGGYLHQLMRKVNSRLSHPRLSYVVTVPSTHSDRTALFMFLNKETLPILQDSMILYQLQGYTE